MRFLFYGTLIADRTPPALREIHRRLVPLGVASVPGRLFAIPDQQGWYPALLQGVGTVHGQLYATAPDFSQDDLAALDEYENSDPARPDHSDYLRESIMALDRAGITHGAQIYRWCRPLPSGARAIPGGHFADWLAENGLSAWGA